MKLAAPAPRERHQQRIVTVATREREIMLERQRDGIAKAKSEGKYSNAYEVKRVARLIGPAAAAKQLGIARSTVYRLLERPARTKQNRQTGSSFMPLVLSY